MAKKQGEQKKNLGNRPSQAAASTKQKTFHIVGIGASAGGLEAIELLFKKMPPDSGMAFVIKLSAGYPSAC